MSNSEFDAGIVHQNTRDGGTVIGGMTKQIFNSSSGNFDSVVVRLND